MLTILLTLHGRVPFTLRWLKWCALNRCPYRIIIADASSDRRVQDMLALRECAGLDVEYIPQAPDLNLRFWFRKLADLASRAATPFVMHADNDDFILFDALADALARAEQGSGDSVYGRSVYRIGFRPVEGDAAGHLYPREHAWVKTDEPARGAQLLANRDPLVRFDEAVKDLAYSQVLWYGLLARPFAKGVHQNILAAEYSLTIFQEFHFLYAAALRAPCVVESAPPFVARQDGTSSQAASLYPKERLDYIHMQPSWSRDLSRMIDGLWWDARQSGVGMGADLFREHVREQVWTLCRTKTRYLAFSDQLRTTKWGSRLQRVRRRMQHRGYRRLDKCNESSDLQRLWSFLKGGANSPA